MDSSDPVHDQLRKLREGSGLTLERLKASGAVMSALGTSDPVEGQDLLVRAVSALAPPERRDALRVDLGVTTGDVVPGLMVLRDLVVR